jgi:hypothetical protein
MRRSKHTVARGQDNKSLKMINNSMAKIVFVSNATLSKYEFSKGATSSRLEPIRVAHQRRRYTPVSSAIVKTQKLGHVIIAKSSSHHLPAELGLGWADA